MRYAGHVERVWLSIGAHRVLMGRPEGERPLGRSRRRWGDNIEMSLQEFRWSMYWIDLAEYRDTWPAPVKAVRSVP
jgi:hypothetical protein